MNRFYPLLLLCLIISCSPSQKETVSNTPVQNGGKVQPLAILQPGEYPLWFQLTEEGPVLLESIYDACFSAALIPWPLALHFSHVLVKDDEILLTVNRDGFMKVSPWNEPQSNALGLYRFSSSAFWRQYTVGALVFYDEKPTALLYRDDRFLDSEHPLPENRTWTFNMESNVPFPIKIPALEFSPVEEGWDADSLRFYNGYWYYRMTNSGKLDGTNMQGSRRMLRTPNLDQAGEDIPLAVFQNSALGNPLAAAPGPLKALLSTAFKTTGSNLAIVVSPEFSYLQIFTGNSDDSSVLYVYYREGFCLAVNPNGEGLFINMTENGPVAEPFSLPALPPGFYYTALVMSGDNVLACWEEQEDYNTGASGFTVLKVSVPSL